MPQPVGLRERLHRMTDARESALFVYRGEEDLVDIACGIAVASRRPAVVLELLSNDLKWPDQRTLIDPLINGQVLVLVHKGQSSIPARLAAYWPEFCKTKHYVAPIARHLATHGP